MSIAACVACGASQVLILPSQADIYQVKTESLLIDKTFFRRKDPTQLQKFSGQMGA